MNKKIDIHQQLQKNKGEESQKKYQEEAMAESSKVGKKIKDLRQERNLSQYKLAEKADVSQSFLSALEAGKKSPTVETLEKICRALGISLSEFFSRGNPRLFPNLPPYISSLIDELRELTPEQISHLSEFIRSLNFKEAD